MAVRETVDPVATMSLLTAGETLVKRMKTRPETV